MLSSSPTRTEGGWPPSLLTPRGHPQVAQVVNRKEPKKTPFDNTCFDSDTTISISKYTIVFLP